MEVPVLNTFPQDDNPEGVSQSLPTATEGWWERGTQLLGQLLDYQIRKDEVEASQLIAQNGRVVAQQRGVALPGGSTLNADSLMRVALLAALGVGLFVVVKRLA
jgi:hypothetical protein